MKVVFGYHGQHNVAGKHYLWISVKKCDLGEMRAIQEW